MVGEVEKPRTTTPKVQTEKEQPNTARKTGQSGNPSRHPTGCFPLLKGSLRKQGYDKQTISLITDAWRTTTKKSYTTYLNKWNTFCLERAINPLSPTLPQACRFLRLLSNKGLGYGAVNTARCALSTLLPDFDNKSFGNHPYVCWLVKGSYQRNPPKPRYAPFWDVNKVFELFKRWGPNKDLTLKELTLKLTMLLLLVSSQTIVNLTVDGLESEEAK